MIDVNTFCEYSYRFSYIPMYLYVENTLQTVLHSFPDEVFLPDVIKEQLLSNSRNISMLETSIHSYYGKVRIEETSTCIILGPIYPGEYSENTIRKFLYSYQITSKLHPLYKKHLLMIPSCSLLSFVALLQQVHYALTGVTDTALGSEQLIEQTIDADQIVNKYSDLSNEPTQISEYQIDYFESDYHNTLYDFEKMTFPLIENGDIEGLYRFSKTAPPLNLGHFGNDPRIDKLVLLIITTFHSMTAAIRGGLDQQTALSLAEFYISRGLKLHTPSEIDSYSNKIAFDFALQVRDIKYPDSTHHSIHDSIQFIREKIYTKITPSDAAQYSGYSLEHFSRLFKKEMGFNVSEFISSLKLYEAQKLLKTTKMSISEISSRLYFYDQSYFQKLFKKKFHITPMQYRNSKDDSNLVSRAEVSVKHNCM